MFYKGNHNSQLSILNFQLSILYKFLFFMLCCLRYSVGDTPR